MQKMTLIKTSLVTLLSHYSLGCKVVALDSDMNNLASEGGYQADFMCQNIPEFNIIEEMKLPMGQTQLSKICSRSTRNKVTSVFCNDSAPSIKSLKDLQNALGLNIETSSQGQGFLGFGGFFGGGFGGRGADFTFTAASSSLVGRFTSEINPRLIMFSTPRPNDPNMVALGFVRGEQFVELVARDTGTSILNFYLVKFSQKCNRSPEGCNSGDLLGPDVERNWEDVTLYQDIDIENTILDCKQCHQPGGVGTQKILRMQELRNPWTHFLSATTNGGRELLADFQKAHPNQEFAGIPASLIPRSQPAQLEQFVRQNGFGNQPNEFPSAQIEGGGGIGFFGFFSQARSNPRDVWSPLYERSVRGEAIAPPYYKLKVSDPEKVSQMTQAYLDLAANRISKEEFPDTRNIHPNRDLRDLQYMVKEGLSGQEILIQACSQCHNSRLNQKISRANFDVDLSKMSPEAIDRAIERMNLSCDDPLKMPPVRFRTLNGEEIRRASQYLRQNSRPAEKNSPPMNPNTEPGSLPKSSPPVAEASDTKSLINGLNFNRDINPILIKSCSGAECHSNGNIRLNPVYVENASQFLKANPERIKNGSMPPSGSDKKLTKAEQEILLKFLDK